MVMSIWAVGLLLNNFLTFGFQHSEVGINFFVGFSKSFELLSQIFCGGVRFS